MKIKAEYLETLDAETADLNHYLRNASDSNVDAAEVFERIATVIESLRVVAISALPEENRTNWLAYDGATLSTAANDARQRSNDLFNDDEDGCETAECSGCDETVLAGTLTTTTGLCEECDDEEREDSK